MKNFYATTQGDGDFDDRAEEAFYQRHLPRQSNAYYMVVELQNLEKRKLRLVSLKSQEDTDLFISLFNLISSYRRYEENCGE